MYDTFFTRPNTHVLFTTPILRVLGSFVFTGRSPSTPRSIIINFLQVVHYRRPAYLRSKELQQAVRDEIPSWGLDIPKWDTIIPPSCAMAEMSYSGHSFEQKLLISVRQFQILWSTFDLTRPTALHLVRDLHGRQGCPRGSHSILYIPATLPRLREAARSCHGSICHSSPRHVEALPGRLGQCDCIVCA